MEAENKNIGDSIFWIEVDKIRPNPFQPRKEFDESKLKDLADSIRQYGVLQPLVVTRKEVEKEDGGLAVEYELIAGERRWRASKIAGVAQIPVVIRVGEQTDLMKLEIAIIENIQREDLNPLDKARAFQELSEKFRFTHVEISKKIGKSREYVSNCIRILALPEEILKALTDGKINEGHTRPLLMLVGRPEEQLTLFKEILTRKLTVREAELISRKIAVERIRKQERVIDPEIIDLESQLTEKLGARVSIESKDFGNRVTIDFFSRDDLKKMLSVISSSTPPDVEIHEEVNQLLAAAGPINDVPPVELKDQQDDADLYSVSNFSV